MATEDTQRMDGRCTGTDNGLNMFSHRQRVRHCSCTQHSGNLVVEEAVERVGTDIIARRKTAAGKEARRWNATVGVATTSTSRRRLFRARTTHVSVDGGRGIHVASRSRPLWLQVCRDDEPTARDAGRHCPTVGLTKLRLSKSIL